MGHRIVKRVPLNFEWPLNVIWGGYISPLGLVECLSCNGTGYNPKTQRIADEFYDQKGSWRYNYGTAPDGSATVHPPWQIFGQCKAWHAKITQDEVEALVAEGRLMDFTHTFKTGKGWEPKQWDIKGFWCSKCHEAVPQLSPEHYSDHCTGCDNEMELLEGDDMRLHIPTAEEVNAWELQHGTFGHDGFNRYILVETRAKRFGVWGECEACQGKGEILTLDPKVRKRYEEWQEYEPPSGEGWQLWETTCRSPYSPVFPSAEKLADWCEENATVVGSRKTTKENWLEMFLGQKDIGVESSLVTSR